MRFTTELMLRDLWSDFTTLTSDDMMYDQADHLITVKNLPTHPNGTSNLGKKSKNN